MKELDPQMLTKIRKRVLVLGDDDFISLIDFQCLAAVDVEGEIEALRAGWDLAVQLVREDVIVPGMLTAKEFQPWESAPEESARRVDRFVESVLANTGKILPGDLCWFGVPTQSLNMDMLLGNVAPKKGMAVRIVKSEEELRKIFDDLSLNGVNVDSSGYVGNLLRLPDESLIGWRTKTRWNQYPAIDIYVISDVRQSGLRIHVENDWEKMSTREQIIALVEDDYISLVDFRSVAGGGDLGYEAEALRLGCKLATQMVLEGELVPGFLYDNFQPWTSSPAESVCRIREWVKTLIESGDPLLFGEPCWFDLSSTSPGSGSSRWGPPCSPDSPPWKDDKRKGDSSTNNALGLPEI